MPLLFALALGLRLALILLLPQQPFSDGTFYIARARELAQGLGYQEAGFPTAFWPVGYPALLAASMRLLGPTLLGPMLVNLASAALILWLILWFARSLGVGELAARFAGLLYALYPAHIAYAGAVLSETSSTAVAMAAFALLIAGRRSWWGWPAAGILFGIATLMRAQMLFFPIGAVVALVACRRFGWRDALKAILIVHLALAAVVLPWSLRNQQVMGEFVLVSTNGGVGLYTGANDQATGDWFAWEHGPLWDRVGIPFSQRIARQMELDRRFRALSWDWIGDHPDRWAGLGFKKMALLWRKDSDGFWSLQHRYPQAGTALAGAAWANQLYYAALMGLSLVCFGVGAAGVLRRDPRTAPLGLLLCMPVFVSLTAFVFTGQIRYHYPAMPFVIVAAGWTLARLASDRLRIRVPRTR